MRPAPYWSLLSRYWDFLTGSLAGSLAGSWVVAPGVELLGELVLPLAAPELLGCAAELELDPLVLGEVALAPPEAEPDLAASLEPDPLIPAEELDEEPGVDDAPLDGDEAEPPGVAAVLELEEPGVDEVLLVSPRSHAASPRAIATATARIESFTSPPWLGFKDKQQQLARPT